MESKKALLLLNGAPPKKLPDLSNYDLVCAIDGGYNFFKQQKIQPDLITGDFDSITQIPEDVEVISTPDQNFTDFHKSLEILHARNMRTIDVFGGSGNEVDHFLGNLSTALKWKEKLKLTFFDDYGHFFFIDKSFVGSDLMHRTISLVPFPTAHGISTQGLQYPLKKEALTFGKRIGTRNKAVQDTIEISYQRGALFIYISNT